MFILKIIKISMDEKQNEVYLNLIYQHSKWAHFS